MTHRPLLWSYLCFLAPALFLPPRIKATFVIPHPNPQTTLLPLLPTNLFKTFLDCIAKASFAAVFTNQFPQFTTAHPSPYPTLNTQSSAMAPPPSADLPLTERLLTLAKTLQCKMKML